VTSKPQLPSFRFSWRELGGALGDLGVLLPLLVALITLNGLSVTGVFIGVGLAYILAGVYYRIPIPVQPLKAMSAVAIAQGLSGSVIAAGGWWMAAILLLLAITGAARWIGRLFNRPVVRGIQLGLGLLLVRSGVMLVGRSQVVFGGEEAVIYLGGGRVPLNWLLAGVAALLLVLALRRSRWPAALIVLAFGAIVALTIGQVWPDLGEVELGLNLPQPLLPQASDFPTALLLLVIPQLPLTLGNAVFATANTSRTYFGDQARRVTPRALLTTMGLSQALAAAIGGIPICHGSGGLTAHYRLGARTGAAPLMIGVVCLSIGLFVDGNVLPILALIPYPVLGILLAFAGLQHSLLVRDLRRWDEILTAACVAAAGWMTHNLAIGFGTGILVWQVCRLARMVARRRPIKSSKELAPRLNADA
jgi:SulP family sulfate permease